MKSPKAPAPDPLIGQSAMAQAELSKEHLAWMKQIYAETADDRAKATDVALRESEAQISLADQQRTLSDEANARYKTTFQPLEDAQVAEAREYDTPERREQAAGQAMENVGAQFGNARLSLGRTVGASGGNPNSGNFMATMGGLSLREAATKAAAGNAERQRVEAVGDAKINDAIALGRGVVTQGANQAQMSLASGNSGVGNVQVPLNVASQGAGMMTQGVNTAMQGYSNAGNLALGQYRTQVDASRQNSGAMGALGNVVGSAVSAGKFFGLSDKNKKKGIKRMSDKEGTRMIRKMPVDSWQYKKGAGDGGKHIGPMAQAAHKAGGDRLAPGGKMIDLVNANGITLAAARDLDKRLQRVEKHMKGAK